MAYSQVTICNEALAEIRHPSIASLDEVSTEAAQCSRYYQQTLDEMLEAHEWGFAGRRVTLAAIANDREAEWRYAYAVPSGVGTPRRILPTVTAPSQVAAYPGTYAPSYPSGTLWRDYIIEGSTLYASIPEAILEYGASDVDVATMPALFRRALALNIAARLAIPLRDSGTMKESLQKDAAIAFDRAMADDKNRQPNHDAYDDVALVRQGAWLGWPAYGQR